jgi:hypothetical protein
MIEKDDPLRYGETALLAAAIYAGTKHDLNINAVTTPRPIFHLRKISIDFFRS